MWSELIARIVTAAGVTRDDVAQVSFGYGMFTGGFGLHYGLEKVGATVVPHSAGNTARQIQFMQDFGTTVLIATPSYALYIGEVLREQGIDPASLKLRLGLFGAEACSEEMRAQIEARLPHACHRQLRPHRGHRPRRRRRVRVPRRPARQRGPLHRRVPRPGERRAGGRG